LYEAYRQKLLAGHYEQRKLREGLSSDLLSEWGFLNPEDSDEVTNP
jgi:hypothetical protein